MPRPLSRNRYLAARAREAMDGNHYAADRAVRAQANRRAGKSDDELIAEYIARGGRVERCPAREADR